MWESDKNSKINNVFNSTIEDFTDQIRINRLLFWLAENFNYFSMEIAILCFHFIKADFCLF